MVWNKLDLTDEERRERRRARAREHYRNNREEVVAAVSECRRRRKRRDPNYVPREERVTPPEVLAERKARKYARNAAYREKNKAKVTARQVERKKERRRLEPGFVERERAYTQKWRDKNPDQARESAREASRRKRATEEGREENRRRCGEYQKANRNVLLPKQRARHLANREANNAKRKQHYDQHKEEMREGWRERLRYARTTSPWKFARASARARAKKKGVPFDITSGYLLSIWTGRCALTGLPFRVSKGSGPSARSPSLDRVDPKLGYVVGNVRFILWAVNACKAEGTDAEMYEVAEAILLHRKTLQKQALTRSEGRSTYVTQSHARLGL